jgi:hypothetical protein
MKTLERREETALRTLDQETGWLADGAATDAYNKAYGGFGIGLQSSLAPNRERTPFRIAPCRARHPHSASKT